MKKIIITIVFVFITCLILGQAKIDVDKKTYKFPKTKEGIQLSHTYKITNKGDKPLIINDYKVACSCTKLEFPKTPIMPNQTAELIVSFDTKGKIGWQDRIITIYSNAENSPIKIRFKVMVDND